MGRKINTDVALDILIRHHRGFGATELARAYGLGRSSVTRIIAGDTHERVYREFCQARDAGTLPPLAELSSLSDLRAERRDGRRARDARRLKAVTVQSEPGRELEPKYARAFEEFRGVP